MSKQKEQLTLLLHFFFSLSLHLEKKNENKTREHKAEISIFIKDQFQCVIPDQLLPLLVISPFWGNLCSDLSLNEGKNLLSLS